MYLQCRDCHSLEKDDINRVGPTLQGLLGSTAGQAEGFDYSDVLVESGIVWTPRTLDELLARPGEFLPGNRMVFAGIGDPEDRANLILYLQQATRAADEKKAGHRLVWRHGAVRAGNHPPGVGTRLHHQGVCPPRRPSWGSSTRI